MGIAQWLGVILTFANVCCALIYMYAPRRHHHEWHDWEKWTLSQTPNAAEVLRYRHCETCDHVQKQSKGWHACIEAQARRRCTHLDHTMGMNITRLEKELGL